MITSKTFFFFFIIILFTSCIGRRAFYVSPFNGLSNPYHTIPLQQDSVQSAFYANGVLAFGNANSYGGDKTFVANLNLSRSQNFGNFQAFYGIGFSAGSYEVDTFAMLGNNRTVNPVIINANAGKKNFNGFGFAGGINYVLPFENGEWRVMGFETSVYKESGNYLKFRETLPDSAATIIIRNDVFATAGGYSEIIGKTSKFSYGFKLGIGTILGGAYRVRSIIDADITRNGKLSYNYANLTLHFSKNKFTGFTQFNFATKANSFMIGANYRLGK